MAIRFYNTFTRELETFTSSEPGKVRLYTCGPTVYNYAHIGNLRAYMFEDLLQRHLESRGYAVHRVMNLTDVDDKTIRGCREAGIALADFTEPFKQAFLEDLDTLRIKRATEYPAATEDVHIARMIEMIGQLIDKGYAYQAEDQSVYFRIQRFAEYGKLAHLNLEELRPTGRIRNDDYDKEHIGDFALWKAWDEEDGDVGWESPWGRGRPGWHIECSAMATGLLGNDIDIHCGAVDNIFPHHEAEIAQSEACSGERFVRYWLHCAHLIVDGRKMSKSLGNFFTLRDILDKGYTGREIRFALISVHYQLQLNFTMEGLEAARASLQRLDEWVERLGETAAGTAPGENFAHAGLEGFFESLDDNLNISEALGHLFEVVRETNRAMDAGSLSAGTAASLLSWWERVDAILQFSAEAAPVPPAVQALVEERQSARAAKDWARSDALRDAIAAEGWVVKDTREGPKLTPVAR